MCLTLHLSTSQTHVTQLHLNPHPLYALLMSPLPSYILHFPSSLAYFDHYHICNQPFVLPPPHSPILFTDNITLPSYPSIFPAGSLAPCVEVWSNRDSESPAHRPWHQRQPCRQYYTSLWTSGKEQSKG